MDTSTSLKKEPQEEELHENQPEEAKDNMMPTASASAPGYVLNNNITVDTSLPNEAAQDEIKPSPAGITVTETESVIKTEHTTTIMGAAESKPSVDCPTAELGDKVQDSVATTDSSSIANSDTINKLPTTSQAFTFTGLERLRSGVSSEVYDKGIDFGCKLLKGLRDALSEAQDSNEATQWLKEIASIENIIINSRTVVGVLGNTGAGKSSLINAVLDEGKLIATSCMRACTAVPTEICYNSDPDPARRYRAEVEFINKDEWKQEVDTLLRELIDEKKLNSDYAKPDTDANIAYEKIKAVFPQVTHAMLISMSQEDLLGLKAVKNILDTVKKYACGTADELRAVLRDYSDSAEKSGFKSKGGKVAYWPLVKVVRIYIKARALESGTVLVDLPGVQDSNAARSAVGERYLTQCTALWIVSPINRAVDDKAAKQLLGSSFRQQLTMDGNYCNVTFVCSKTTTSLLGKLLKSWMLTTLSRLFGMRNGRSQTV